MIEFTPMLLNSWCEASFQCSKSKGFHDAPFNAAEKIALMHSELSELLEAHRKDPRAICPKVPTITLEDEEVADLFLRLADFCGARGIDLEKAVAEKYRFNLTRPHKHGKAF